MHSRIIDLIRTGLFILDFDFYKRYLNKNYTITESGLKGRKCLRDNDLFIKDVVRNHPRYFSYVNEMKITKYLDEYDFVPKFMVMEEMEDTTRFVYKFHCGRTLSDILKYKIMLGESDYQFLEESLLKILDVLSEKKIVHRDINPTNILFDVRVKKVWLIDFQWATYEGVELDVDDADKDELKRCLSGLNRHYRNPVSERFGAANDRYAMDKLLIELRDR